MASARRFSYLAVASISLSFFSSSTAVEGANDCQSDPGAMTHEMMHCAFLSLLLFTINTMLHYSQCPGEKDSRASVHCLDAWAFAMFRMKNHVAIRSSAS